MWESLGVLLSFLINLNSIFEEKYALSEVVPTKKLNNYFSIKNFYATK